LALQASLSITLLSLFQICHGGDVPEHYYLEEDTQVKVMETTTVLPGSDHKIEFDVTKTGSIIK